MNAFLPSAVEQQNNQNSTVILVGKQHCPGLFTLPRRFSRLSRRWALL